MNARQAMPGGGRITIRTENFQIEAQQAVRVTITDTGTGIDPQILPRIFDPFFTTKQTGEGTGLGLSVSFGIVQEHQGEIQVDSTPGQGTRFFVTLPPAEAFNCADK
jgi:signal transduction histidine kinase